MKTSDLGMACPSNETVAKFDQGISKILINTENNYKSRWIKIKLLNCNLKWRKKRMKYNNLNFLKYFKTN